MTAELFHDHNSKALILFKRGHSKLHCLMIAPPVRVVKVEKTEERHFTPLTLKGEPYPLRRALRRFKAAGKALGITDAARAVLRELLSPSGEAQPPQARPAPFPPRRPPETPPQSSQDGYGAPPTAPAVSSPGGGHGPHHAPPGGPDVVRDNRAIPSGV